MLSIGRIGAGDGYRYLTGQVASQDAPRAGERLVGYYERTGYPPGTWVGAQAGDLGLSGSVDEQSMQALFGQCCDPSDGSQLGRRMAIYRTVDERVADRLSALGHTATDDERAEIESQEVQAGTPQAATGFDLTFSAPKSVSVLFALGNDDTRETVRQAHEAAWREAFGYFEDQVAATRLGAGGVAQVDVRGVSAAAFEHWYSRAGDPQLHTHVATSVMVQTEDGRWRRLDSRAMYRASAAAGELYTATLMANLAERTGVSWRHRSSGRSGKALPEIAGVSDELIRAFSHRSRAVEDSLATLAGEYRTKHGYVPTRETLARLAQQATLSDRPDNEQRSLDESRRAWAQEAAKVVGCRPDQVGARLAHEVARVGPPLKPLRRGKAYQQAQKTVDALVDSGATWSEWDLRRAATAQLREAGFRVDGAGVDKVVNLTLGLPEVLAVAPPVAEETPESLRRSDGASVFERRGEARYTSRRVVDAEAALVALAQLRGLSPAEIARRKTTLFAEVEDDALVAGMDGARRHISELAQRLAVQHQVAAAAQDDVVQARVALATHRPEDGPRLRLVRQQSQAERVAAERVAVIRETLGRRGLRRTSQAERAQLQAERVTLMRQHPYASESPAARQVRIERAVDQALRADRSSREQLVAQHGQAKSTLGLAAGKVRVLEAEITEQSQAAEALAAELRVRQAATGRVDLTGRLEGLGVDQAAAITRLSDPSRPLDALIGPAGSGKTTALERLVAAFGEAGRSVQVLAPTAVGAQALGEAVNSPYSTMHSALGAWRKGLDLPGPGDLVLMDEASMGTTSMILETAQVAIGRGALVRLIGDPRQLKAVGAGGGLALVAEAVGAPELSELRRFNHAWEAQATLGLRRGDTDAIDAYIGHDRVVGALDAVATDDVFRDWWNSPAGRAHTIMVASDNATVRQLNLLARQARLAAGEITASSAIELHDATLAGPGDLVTTRANDITTATRRNAGKGAYVRNHDRWVIDEVGQDGSLLVSHLDRGEQVRLGSAYAGQHVELAYADTGHAVQGRAGRPDGRGPGRSWSFPPRPGRGG